MYGRMVSPYGVPGAPVSSATFSEKTPSPQFLCVVSHCEGTCSIACCLVVGAVHHARELGITSAPCIAAGNPQGAHSRSSSSDNARAFTAAQSYYKTTLQTPVVVCAPATGTGPQLLPRH